MLVVKRIAAVLVAGGLLVGVSGCGEPSTATDSQHWRIAYVMDPKTHREVRCIINEFSTQSGVSCDWADTK